jgi:hypothetical protein
MSVFSGDEFRLEGRAHARGRIVEARVGVDRDLVAIVTLDGSATWGPSTLSEVVTRTVPSLQAIEFRFPSGGSVIFESYGIQQLEAVLGLEPRDSVALSAEKPVLSRDDKRERGRARFWRKLLAVIAGVFAGAFVPDVVWETYGTAVSGSLRIAVAVVVGRLIWPRTLPDTTPDG